VTVVIGLVILYLSTTISSGPEPSFSLIGYPLGFMITATAAYAIIVAVIAKAQAKFLTNRRWAFPSCCGILLTVFTVTGLVENSTDVVGQVIGHQYEHVMLVASVFFWTLIATSIVTGLGLFLSKKHNQSIQETP